MIQPVGPLIYEFGKSYFENVYINMYQNLAGSGEAAALFEDVFKEQVGGDIVLPSKYETRTRWVKVTDMYGNTELVEETYQAVVETSATVGKLDIREHVWKFYNGQTQVCLLDRIVREIQRINGQILSAVLGDEIGCAISEALYKMWDEFTDILGTFICTATLQATDQKCADRLVQNLIEYRNLNIPTREDGMAMIKYYYIVGPKVVKAIDSRVDREEEYKYLYDTYIADLSELVEEGSSGTDKFIKRYFEMMDYCVKSNSIEVSKKFYKWMDKYKKMEVIDGM